MGWFRANSKLGGRLALFALALQLVLSFAHIHPDEIYGSLKGPFPAPGVSLSTASPEHFASSDQSAVVDNDVCAVCAAVSLLSGSVAADAPKLLFPELQSAERATRELAIFVTPPRRPFQSRAPPTA